MTSPRGHILVVDDEKDIRSLMQDILEDEGYEVTTAANGVQAREAWRKGAPDVVFLDIWMPDIDGITLLRQMKEEGLLEHSNVVMISGHGTIETAVEATRLGAWDFLEKPLSLNKLLVATERALKHVRLHRASRQFRAQQDWDNQLVGKSRALQQLRADAERLARYTMPVLVRGERGSGRHQFARAVHAQSSRANRPLLVLDAQALNADPERWFGRENGQDVRIGEIENARGGSLVINDIDRLDDTLQSTLLDIIQNGQFQRIGGNNPVNLDVRLFALTEQPLDGIVDAGRMLPQLAQRLQLTEIIMPPLRQRVDDLPDLITYFTDRLAREQGLPWREFTIGAQNVLRQHTWPGNLIELQNLVQRLLLQDEGPIDDTEVRAALEKPATPPLQSSIDTRLPLKAARDAFERDYLRQLLRETGGNVSETAQRAGVERTHLYRKLKQLNIDPKNP